MKRYRSAFLIESECRYFLQLSASSSGNNNVLRQNKISICLNIKQMEIYIGGPTSTLNFKVTCCGTPNSVC